MKKKTNDLVKEHILNRGFEFEDIDNFFCLWDECDKLLENGEWEENGSARLYISQHNSQTSKLTFEGFLLCDQVDYSWGDYCDKNIEQNTINNIFKKAGLRGNRLIGEFETKQIVRAVYLHAQVASTLSTPYIK